MSETQNNNFPKNQNGRTPSQQEGATKWQKRLLSLMKMTVILVAIIITGLSGYSVWVLRQDIKGTPKLLSDSTQNITLDSLKLDESASFKERYLAYQLWAAVRLEVYALERRYHQATVLLIARVWMRYLGFIVGVGLATIGAIFILGKLREPVSSEVEVKSPGGGEGSFKSTSPGIILAGFGVILMLITIITHHKITVVDTPIYTRTWYVSSETPQQLAQVVGVPEYLSQSMPFIGAMVAEDKPIDVKKTLEDLSPETTEELKETYNELSSGTQKELKDIKAPKDVGNLSSRASKELRDKYNELSPETQKDLNEWWDQNYNRVF